MVLRSALLTVLLAIGAALCLGGQGDPVSARIRNLRSLPDEARAVETKSLAREIAGMPASSSKVSLASGLANLATEGDFGRDTLQAVTDMLAGALRESPAKERSEAAMRPYVQLAQLERFEGMKVNLANDPNYGVAVLDVLAIERERAAVDFTLSDLDGKSWTRSALAGKVVLVNFWATWCPPCRKEMPDLEKLYRRFKSQGLLVLAISDEEPSRVKSFIAEHGYTYPVLIDSGRKVNSAYRIDGIPKNFVYGRDGKLVAQAIDMRTERQFLQMLARAGLR